MAQLSEWLDIMLGEIARKQDEAARAAAEEARRAQVPSQPQSQSQPASQPPSKTRTRS
jgi:hypothetical protein